MNYILVLIVVVLIGVILFSYWYKKRRKEANFWKLSTDTKVYRIVARHPSPHAITPLGASVWKEDEAMQLPAGLLDAVDAGLTETANRLACLGFPATRADADEAEIVFLKSERTPGGNIGFRIYISPTSPYKDEDYKTKDGDYYIYAAGQFVVVPPRIALPDPLGDFAYATVGAQHEEEHRLLLKYWRDRFFETIYHTTSGHPILPACGSSLTETESSMRVVADEELGCVLMVK